MKPTIIRSDEPAACWLTWECRSCGERWTDTDECPFCGVACDRVLIGPDGATLAVIACPGERVSYRRRYDDPLNVSRGHPLIYRATLDQARHGERGFYDDCLRKRHLRPSQVAHFLTAHPGGL